MKVRCPIRLLSRMPASEFDDSVVRTSRPHPGVLVADGLFGADQISELLDAVDRVGLQVQRVGLARVDGLPERRQRGETRDETIPTVIWSALRTILPPLTDWFEEHEEPRVDPAVSAWRAVGCNPWTRIYRYGLGERFAPHTDEPWRPSAEKRTFLTVLVYLPTPVRCTGGETVVYGNVVACNPGRCVVFDHRLLHEGRPIESGQKLALRSDIVYETGAPGKHLSGSVERR